MVAKQNAKKPEVKENPIKLEMQKIATHAVQDAVEASKAEGITSEAQAKAVDRISRILFSLVGKQGKLAAKRAKLEAKLAALQKQLADLS